MGVTVCLGVRSGDGCGGTVSLLALRGKTAHGGGYCSRSPSCLVSESEIFVAVIRSHDVGCSFTFSVLVL